MVLVELAVAAQYWFTGDNMIPIPKDFVLRHQMSDSSYTKINIRTSITASEEYNTVRKIVQQPDGKVIIIGDFDKWCGVPLTSRFIVRLNTDGSLDTSFSKNLGIGFQASYPSPVLTDVALQNDGKILVTAQMYAFNSISTTGLVRLNSDGTLDTAFKNNIGSLNGVPYAIALQSDGKILLGGNNYWNGAYRSSIIRLNSDGTMDSSFTRTYDSGPNTPINDIAIQSDGKIILAGQSRDLVSGTYVPSLCRLNSDGTLDTAFISALGDGPTYFDGESNSTGSTTCVAIQSDGKIIVGGSFDAWNGNDSANGLVRLNSNGTVDTFFDSQTNTAGQDYPTSITILSNGKALVTDTTGGASLVRYTLNGYVDQSFSAYSSDGKVFTAIELSSGEILVGGKFNSWQGDANYQSIVKTNSAMTALSMSSFGSPPQVVFAVVVGGGGRGNISQGSGGGGGAIVWGLVPSSTAVTIGRGGYYPYTSNGDPSIYGTLYAAGGIGGATTPPSLTYGAGNSGTVGTTASGTNLLYSIGGSGGASASSSTGAATASGGGAGTSGGGGGGANQSGTSSAARTATGGVGGSGFVGGGGGAARMTVSNIADAFGGAGGSGVYSGGTGPSLSSGTASTKYCGGGGGGGYLGAGGNGTAATTSSGASGGAGGTGGGGGGGSPDSANFLGGNGGNGCVLLYW